MRQIKFKVIIKSEKNNIRECWGIDFKEQKEEVIGNIHEHKHLLSSD